MLVKMTSATATRVYLLGLIFSVSLRDLANPIFDAIPTMDLLGIAIHRNAQLYSLQLLALISLSWAAYRPTSALALFIATLGFSIFTAASYAMVYISGFGYLPHSENIHFFLLTLLSLRNLNPADRIWLTRAMIFAIGWSYFAAFLTKIRNVGIDWAWNETLPYYFTTFSLISDSKPLAWLASQKILLTTAGSVTLLFELLALPGLCWKRTRRATIVSALLFHTAVYFLFGIQFLISYVAAFALIWSEDA